MNIFPKVHLFGFFVATFFIAMNVALLFGGAGGEVFRGLAIAVNTGAAAWQAYWYFQLTAPAPIPPPEFTFDNGEGRAYVWSGEEQDAHIKDFRANKTDGKQFVWEGSLRGGTAYYDNESQAVYYDSELYRQDLNLTPTARILMAEQERLAARLFASQMNRVFPPRS